MKIKISVLCIVKITQEEKYVFFLRFTCVIHTWDF